MPNYCCNAVGCSNSTLKQKNVEKYLFKRCKVSFFSACNNKNMAVVDSSASTRTRLDPKQVFTGMFQTLHK